MNIGYFWSVFFKNHTFCVLVESPRRGDSYKYQKRMFSYYSWGKVKYWKNNIKQFEETYKKINDISAVLYHTSSKRLDN